MRDDDAPGPFVPVAKLDHPFKAEILKARLESEGIEAHAITDASGYLRVFGGESLTRTAVMVKEADVERAMEVLMRSAPEQRSDADDLACPGCGSLRTGRAGDRVGCGLVALVSIAAVTWVLERAEVASKHTVVVYVLILLACLLHWVRRRPPHWRCRACGHTWLPEESLTDRPSRQGTRRRVRGGFPCLENQVFSAFVADNSALGIHRAGYNGVASLVPHHSGNNIFVPTYAGLNYETISLSGLEPYRHEATGSRFEPRCEPMRIESADPERVVLVQPETSHSHASARIVFRIEEPHYLHQRIELTFHRRFCPDGQPNRFESLWASYMHMPPDIHVYLKPSLEEGDVLEGWFGVTKADHDAPEMQIRSLPADADIGAEEHLKAMKEQPALSAEEQRRVRQTEWAPAALPGLLDGPLRFYYGFCNGSQMFLLMFKQPERFRLAYSPCGAGKQPAWNPAWDFLLCLEDAELGRTYEWDLCLVVKKFQGRADALAEVESYLK